MPSIRYIALLLLLVLLFLPLGSLAQVGHGDSDGSQEVRVINISTDQLPCSGCPCSDESHSDCDSNCFCCSAYAPVPDGIPFRYAPILSAITCFEKIRALPQVFIPIDVPPQNHA
jgi:hypothetical protein